MTLGLIIFAVPFLMLTACTTEPSTVEASGDVRAFLLALGDRDLAGIEARMDRPALQA